MANEKRLIDANAFLEHWNKEYRHRFPCDMYKVAIANFPTVDAVEVVHGRWEFVPSEKYGRHYTDAICTACKAVLDTHCDNDLEYRQEKIKKKLLYCPNCGAKMDGGNGDG